MNVMWFKEETGGRWGKGGERVGEGFFYFLFSQHLFLALLFVLIWV